MRGVISPRINVEDRDYDLLVEHTRNVSAFPLFTTDAAGLYDLFLAGLPVASRKHYKCRACRKFVDTFGGLVTIDEDGRTASPLWDWIEPVSPFFAKSLRAMSAAVAKAKVNGVFLSSETIWGKICDVTLKARWDHMHVHASQKEMRYRPSPIKTAEQAMAEKLEDHGILCRGLVEFPMETVRQAHGLLTNGTLYRSEKCIGVAKWLLDLHESLAIAKHSKRTRDNLIWRAVATAPPGYCHVRSTMIATLLEDIAAGKAFGDIKRVFDSKMSPIQYQRPQAPPRDGQLAAAEAIVSKLASAGALNRRYASLEEVLPYAIWAPPSPARPMRVGEVFGHLKARPPAPIDIPAQTMTWEKFARTVLPTAERIELLVPRSLGPFFAFVTAADRNAPPILQWDREDARNPVSWYLYHHGSMAASWGLSPGSYCDVDAITMQPSGWTSQAAHQGDGAYFILHGASDRNSYFAGLGLFPEILKSDYHSIRAAMEAYSKSMRLSGRESASACGIAMQKACNDWGQTVRVTSGGTRTVYRLDRWD